MSISELIHNALIPRTDNLNGRTALITGASSGIGLAVAARLALEGCHLHLVARREERLIEIKRELCNLNSQVQISIHCIDLLKPDSIATLEKNGAFEIDILINNAGLAKGLSKVVDSFGTDWSQMISTNVNAAFEISRIAAQKMLKKKQGDIVALSSIAAHVAYEKGAVYCATKHALKAFHEALRLETIEHGLRVISISPGMVETEFSLVRFSGDSNKAKAVYQGVHALNAGDVANSIIFALKQPRHVNLDEIVMKPQQQGNPWTVFRNNSSANT